MELTFSIGWLFSILGNVIWYLLIPGAILVTLVNSEQKIYKNICVCFPCGFILFSFVSFLGYLTNASLESIKTVILLINVVGVIFFLYKARQKKIFSYPPKINIYSDSFKDLILLNVIIIGLFVISLHSEWYPRGDASIHLQGIQNLISEKNLVFPFYSLFDYPIIPDHTYDAYYVLLAMFNMDSGISLDIIWHYSTPIFILFVPLVSYDLFRSLSDDRKLVRFFIISFFICSTTMPGLLNATLTDALVYPNRFYFYLILPLMLSVSIDYLKKGHIKSLVLSILCINTFFFVHQSGFLFTLLLLGGAFILNLFCKDWRESFKKYLILLIFLIVSSLPLLYLKLSPNLSFIQKASDDIWKSHYRFVEFSEGFYAFPIGRYGKWGMLLALCIAIYLFIRKRKDNNSVILTTSLLTASILFPLLIVFNPIIVPFLGKLISYPAIVRMLRVPMYSCIFAYGFYILIKDIKILANNSALSKSIKLFSVIAVVFMIAITQIADRDIGHKVPIISEIVKQIPSGSTVYSDQMTCSDMAQFKKINVPIIKFNGTIDLVPINEKKIEVLHFFSNDSDENFVREVIEKYQVDYVVLNKSKFSGRIKLILNKLFIKVYENKNYSLYQTPD